MRVLRGSGECREDESSGGSGGVTHPWLCTRGVRKVLGEGSVK